MSAMPQELRTLILSQTEIAALARAADYIEAVEGAFRDLASGALLSPPVGYVPGAGGAFHIKAAVAQQGRRWAVIKINGNFPGNPSGNGLPTIQGCLMLSDASNGRLLAVMDSIEITAQRTAAASAVAARYLARRDSTTVAFIGCGTQARYHLAALLALPEFRFAALRCFDVDPKRAEQLRAMGIAAGLASTIATTPNDACRDADVVVTCTTAQSPILGVDDVRPGMFVAAVGADSSSKSEISPALMARARVVPDIEAQAIVMGDLRVAIAAGSLTAADIHAELAQIVAGARPGRSTAEQIFIFDSTGSAIEDLASAAMIYERARAHEAGHWLTINALNPK